MTTRTKPDRQLIWLIGADGEGILARGTDPAEAADDGMRVLTPPGEVEVRSWRAVPWCPDWCDCEEAGTHYVLAQAGSRGSFRGAFVEVSAEEAAAAGRGNG